MVISSWQLVVGSLQSAVGNKPTIDNEVQLSLYSALRRLSSVVCRPLSVVCRPLSVVHRLHVVSFV